MGTNRWVGAAKPRKKLPAIIGNMLPKKTSWVSSFKRPRFHTAIAGLYSLSLSFFPPSVLPLPSPDDVRPGRSISCSCRYCDRLRSWPHSARPAGRQLAAHWGTRPRKRRRQGKSAMTVALQQPEVRVRWHSASAPPWSSAWRDGGSARHCSVLHGPNGTGN